MENDVKVWDTEVGKNIANLQGHQGNIYSIKMSYDGSFAVSVGTDKIVKIWDVRCKKYVDEMDGTQFSEMNEISLSSQNTAGYEYPNQEYSLGIGQAAIGHVDGSMTLWNLNMR